VFTAAHPARMQEIMRAVCADFETELAEFNGKANHVHLLVNFPPKLALPELVNILKGVSSRRLRQEFPELARHITNPGGTISSADLAEQDKNITLQFQKLREIESEILLTGGKAIGLLAIRVVGIQFPFHASSTGHHAGQIETNDWDLEFFDISADELYQAMRADLGEPRDRDPGLPRMATTSGETSM
jgi:Transposase IS200 like